MGRDHAEHCRPKPEHLPRKGGRMAIPVYAGQSDHARPQPRGQCDPARRADREEYHRCADRADGRARQQPAHEKRGRAERSRRQAAPMGEGAVCRRPAERNGRREIQRIQRQRHRQRDRGEAPRSGFRQKRRRQGGQCRVPLEHGGAGPRRRALQSSRLCRELCTGAQSQGCDGGGSAERREAGACGGGAGIRH